MTLINTEGMSPIGPGSEWFWTALSGLVMAVTLLAIYRQLAIARDASAREQLDAFNREWNSERLMRYRLEVWIALRGGADPALVPLAEGSAGQLADFWEGFSTLARAGHLGQRLIWDNQGYASQAWWAILGPHCRSMRVRGNDPLNYTDFEWLAGVMHQMDVHAGSGRSFDDLLTGATLDRWIDGMRDRLRVEEAPRTVIIASPEAMPAAPPATVAAVQG